MGPNMNRPSPPYDGPTSHLLILPWYEIDMHSVEIVLQTLNFDLFPIDTQYYSLSWCWAVVVTQLSVVSHNVKRVNNGYYYGHSVPI